MKSAASFAVVLVTVPDRKTGRSLARKVLQERLAACVNIISGVESHYWWEGRLDTGRELLLVIKTRRARLRALEALVLRHHPYDTPEFLVLPVTAGSAGYLAWLSEAVRKSQ